MNSIYENEKYLIGFLKVPNEICKRVISGKWNPIKISVSYHILRLTVGFKKKEWIYKTFEDIASTLNTESEYVSKYIKEMQTEDFIEHNLEKRKIIFKLKFLEKGWTAIPYILVKSMVFKQMTKSEIRLITYILRKTIGNSYKTGSEIKYNNLSELARKIGYSSPHGIENAIKELRDKNWITLDENSNIIKFTPEKNLSPDDPSLRLRDKSKKYENSNSKPEIPYSNLSNSEPPNDEKAVDQKADLDPQKDQSESAFRSEEIRISINNPKLENNENVNEINKLQTSNENPKDINKESIKEKLVRKENSDSLFPIHLFLKTHFEKISEDSLNKLFSGKDKDYIERTFLLMIVEHERGNINNSEHAFHRLEQSVKNDWILEEANARKIDDYIAKKKSQLIKHEKKMAAINENSTELTKAHTDLKSAKNTFDCLSDKQKEYVVKKIIDKLCHDDDLSGFGCMRIDFDEDFFSPVFEGMKIDFGRIEEGENGYSMKDRIKTYKIYSKTLYDICLETRLIEQEVLK